MLLCQYTDNNHGPMPRLNRRLVLAESVLTALSTGEASRPELIQRTGLHPRSFDRLIVDLRAQGYRILSIRDGRAYYYRLEGEPGGQP